MFRDTHTKVTISGGACRRNVEAWLWRLFTTLRKLLSHFARTGRHHRLELHKDWSRNTRVDHRTRGTRLSGRLRRRAKVTSSYCRKQLSRVGPHSIEERIRNCCEEAAILIARNSPAILGQRSPCFVQRHKRALATSQQRMPDGARFPQPEKRPRTGPRRRDRQFWNVCKSSEFSHSYSGGARD